MKRWFWPGLTCTAMLTALALWFGTDGLERELSNRVGAALSPYAWAEIELDGRELSLKGMAPDPQAQAAALDAVRGVFGIRSVDDRTTLLPIAEPYVFKLEKTADGLLLSGYIPAPDQREPVMLAAEDSAPGQRVIDDLALARGNSAGFMDLLNFALQQARFLKDGEISISGLDYTIRGMAIDDAAYLTIAEQLAKPLPGSGRLSGHDVAKP